MTRAKFDEWIEKGYHWPTGIAVGLTLMVLWNFYFISVAISVAPEIDPGYLNSQDR